jgi:hypothetical protein
MPYQLEQRPADPADCDRSKDAADQGGQSLENDVYQIHRSASPPRYARTCRTRYPVFPGLPLKYYIGSRYLSMMAHDEAATAFADVALEILSRKDARAGAPGAPVAPVAAAWSASAVGPIGECACMTD